MNLNDLKKIVDQLIADGKGHYTLIDNTQGLKLPNKFIEGIVSKQETQLGDRLSFYSIDDLEEDYQWDGELKEEIIKHKEYDAVFLF